jgi:hypothetical protein
VAALMSAAQRAGIQHIGFITIPAPSVTSSHSKRR